MGPDPNLGQVVIHGGVPGREESAGNPQRARGTQDREGSAPQATLPLEEDDVFLAHFFLAEWCKGLWHGQEGEVLGGHVSWGWAWSLAGEVWKTEGCTVSAAKRHGGWSCRLGGCTHLGGL